MDFANRGENNAVSWEADINGIRTDTIKVMFKGSANVSPGETATIALKLKTSD